MKQNFLSQLISGADNQASSKRAAFLFFVLLFSFVLLYNLFTGRQPAEIFSNQLFELVTFSMLAVMGDKFLDLYMEFKGRKVTTKQTIVAPPDSTIVNTETTKEAK